MKKGQMLLLGILAALLIAMPFVAAQTAEDKLVAPIEKITKFAQRIGYPLGALVLIASAGIGTILKSGDPTVMDNVKKRVRNVAIGILIIALAGTIVDVIRAWVA